MGRMVWAAFRLLRVGKRLLQPFQLFLGDGDDRAMARSKRSLSGCILHAFELHQVFAGAELVMPVHVAVVHQNPVSFYPLEHAGTFHRLVGIFKRTGQQFPFCRIVQVFGQILAYAFFCSPSVLKKM